MTTLTVSGTIDEIIAFADLLKIGRGVMIDAKPDPTKLTLKEADLVRTGNVISAIKEVRMRTGIGLREAKDLVEASPECIEYRRSHPVPPPPAPTVSTPRQSDSAFDGDWAAKRVNEEIPF